MPELQDRIGNYSCNWNRDESSKKDKQTESEKRDWQDIDTIW